MSMRSDGVCSEITVLCELTALTRKFSFKQWSQYVASKEGRTSLKYVHKNSIKRTQLHLIFMNSSILRTAESGFNKTVIHHPFPTQGVCCYNNQAIGPSTARPDNEVIPSTQQDTNMPCHWTRFRAPLRDLAPEAFTGTSKLQPQLQWIVITKLRL